MIRFRGIPYARWELTTADLVDERAQRVLATMYPIDKAKNADGRRRALDRIAVSPVPEHDKKSGVAPLLARLIADYRASGLPPAYLPKHDAACEEEDGQ